MTEQGIRERVQKVDGSGPAPSAIHPLELARFHDLMPIVTSAIQYWPTDKPLSAGDFLEILSDCSSIEELQENLAEKTHKISLWDEVFARYFEDADEWKELAKSLTDFVIPVRNRVMYHRPMYLWELRELEETGQIVDTLLASASTELSEEERAQARQVSEEWSQAWAHTLEELTRPMLLPVVNAMRPFLEQQEELSQEWLRILGEMARPAFPTVGDIVGPFWKQQQELSRVFSEFLLGSSPAFVPNGVLEELSRAFRESRLGDQQGQIGRAAQHIEQLTASGTVHVGSMNSVRFHLPTCRHVPRILPENLIRFADRDEAVAKGYVPCGTCKP